MTNTGNALDDLMEAVYEYYTATSGGGGEKDDKWYFEARLNHGRLEINTNTGWMNETQAVKAMGRGKNIMTLNEELVQNVVGRFKGLSKEATEALKLEGPHKGIDGYYRHINFEAHKMRLHCWSWK